MPGVKRGTFCRGTYGVFHRLSGLNRRWKVYYSRVTGLPKLLANGCAACNSLGNLMRYQRQAVARKESRVFGVRS